MKPSSGTSRLLVSLAIIVWGQGCTASPKERENEGDGVVRQVIRATEGGRLESPDGQIALFVPPGAVEADITLTLRALDPKEYPAFVKELEVEGPVYELGPPGTTFQAPATVHWTLSEVDGAFLAVELLSWDETHGLTRLEPPLEPWAASDHLPEGQAFGAFELSHFSVIFENRLGVTVGLSRVADSYPVKSTFNAFASLTLPTGDLPMASPPRLAPASGGVVKEIGHTPGSSANPVYTSQMQYLCEWIGRGLYGFDFSIHVLTDGFLPDAVVDPLTGNVRFERGGVSLTTRLGDKSAHASGSILLPVKCGGEGDFTYYGCCTRTGLCRQQPEDQYCYGRPMYEPCTPESCPNLEPRINACCRDDGTCQDSIVSLKRSCQGSWYPQVSCEALEPCPEGVSQTPWSIDVREFVSLLEAYLDDGQCTELSNGADCKRPEGAQRIDAVLDPLLQVSEEAAATLFGETYACGTGSLGLTVCAPEADDAPGEYVFLMAQFGDTIPLDGDRILQYAFVFETDGDASNDFVPLSAYPKDFFAGTDRWYELLYTPGEGWRMLVREVSPTLAEVPSGARMAVVGRQLAIFIPVTELDPDQATFRVTAFSHTGDYGLTGGPWSGDYYPPLEHPLLPIAQIVFTP